MGTNVSSIADVQGLYTDHDALLHRAGIAGTIYYVDTAGADTNSGLDPSSALLKVETAIGKCTDDAGDWIFVLDCYAEDTYPITIDKSTCHVIGLSLPGTTWGWAALTGGGTQDVIQISDNYVEVAGFSMISAGKDGVHFTAGGYQWLHHCNFAIPALSLENGVELDTENVSNALIEDCNFGQSATYITGYGIYGNMNGTTIRRCRFKSCDTAAIYCNTSTYGGYIYDNIIVLDDERNGEAITLASPCDNFVVVNNFAVKGMLSSGYTYNPYRDLNANTANAWGMNYMGNTVVEPVGI